MSFPLSLIQRARVVRKKAADRGVLDDHGLPLSRPHRDESRIRISHAIRVRSMRVQSMRSEREFDLLHCAVAPAFRRLTMRHACSYLFPPFRYRTMKRVVSAILVLSLALPAIAQGPRRRGVTRSAPEATTVWLETAKQTGAWLESVAQQRGEGLGWAANPGTPAAVTPLELHQFSMGIDPPSHFSPANP